MRNLLGAAVLAALTGFQAQAQTEAKLPDLPAPASAEKPMPALPQSSSSDLPDLAPPGIMPAAPQRQLTEDEIQRLKQDENWLVEGMKKKQDEDAAAQLEKKASELNSKKEETPKEHATKPGEMASFKPVLSDNSFAVLNPNTSPLASKKKSGNDNNVNLDNTPVSSTGSNPLTTSSTGLVQPILGPIRRPLTNNLNPGLGVTPLPETGIKKISGNPNFIPEGYADSWTKQQTSPYQPLIPQVNKPIPPPAAPLTPRPTFRDLANTIPDPSQVR